MSTPVIPSVVYPDSDGEPMADNTLQYRWIVVIKENLEIVFRDRADVFVGADLLWYPVEGDNAIRQAPDVMVALGRPKGDRGSYRQWEEDGIAPQVVFEVWSPGNRFGAMLRKLDFYDRYGVEEYYLFNPYTVALDGWRRDATGLAEVEEVHGWTSPRLGIRFHREEDTLRIAYPDGQPFLTFLELDHLRREAERRADEERQRADEERLAREQAQRRADEERRRADEERRRADEERRGREQAEGRAQEAEGLAQRLAAQLRALGIDPAK